MWLTDTREIASVRRFEWSVESSQQKRGSRYQSQKQTHAQSMSDLPLSSIEVMIGEYKPTSRYRIGGYSVQCEQQAPASTSGDRTQKAAKSLIAHRRIDAVLRQQLREVERARRRFPTSLVTVAWLSSYGYLHIPDSLSFGRNCDSRGQRGVLRNLLLRADSPNEEIG